MISHISRVIFQKQSSLQMSLTCNSATKCCDGLRMRLCSSTAQLCWRAAPFGEVWGSRFLQGCFSWRSQSRLMQQGSSSVLIIHQTLVSTEDYISIGNFVLGRNQFLLQESFLLLLLTFPHSCQVSLLVFLHHVSLWVWSGCTEVILPSSEDLIAWLK